MNDIRAKLSELLRDRKRLEQLLLLEKKRRGVPPGTLLFAGMANVAHHWWCTQEAVFKSRANEPDFFGAYLANRILYADRFGLVSEWPGSSEALLLC